MITNIDELFNKLQASSFRRKFRLNAHDAHYLQEKGTAEISAHAHKFVTDRLAPALPKNDGKQTPYRGHPVFVAQHATATCCRSCLSKWHNIPKRRELTVEQQAYVVSVIIKWLEIGAERK